MARRKYIDYDNAEYYEPTSNHAPHTYLADGCYQEEGERDSPPRRHHQNQRSHVHHHSRQIPMAILDSDKTNLTKHNRAK